MAIENRKLHSNFAIRIIWNMAKLYIQCSKCQTLLLIRIGTENGVAFVSTMKRQSRINWSSSLSYSRMTMLTKYDQNSNPHQHNIVYYKSVQQMRNAPIRYFALYIFSILKISCLNISKLIDIYINKLAICWHQINSSIQFVNFNWLL